MTIQLECHDAGVTSLRRALGLFSLTLYGVGIIVGAGVYSVIGAAAGLSGEALWMSFVLAAAVALLTGLSYAELATAFPRAGAEYVYLRKALPEYRWVAFAVGFVGRIPLLPVLGTVAIAGLLVQFDPVVYAVVGAVLILGLGLRVAWRLRISRQGRTVRPGQR